MKSLIDWKMSVTCPIFSSHVSKFLRHFSGKQLQENCLNLKLWLQRKPEKENQPYFCPTSKSLIIADQYNSYCAMSAAKSNNCEILATRQKSYFSNDVSLNTTAFSFLFWMFFFFNGLSCLFCLDRTVKLPTNQSPQLLEFSKGNRPKMLIFPWLKKIIWVIGVLRTTWRSSSGLQSPRWSFSIKVC